MPLGLIFFHALVLIPWVSWAEDSPAKNKLPISVSRSSLPNGCLVDAIAYQDALKAKERLERRWSRVLILGWQEKGTVKGHALCVFEYQNAIWAYDPAKGTIPLTRNLALKTKSDALARLWLGPNAHRMIWAEFP
ncbi:MAG: hypothetical protein OHK005_13560 [Candidatus Methylacidiphilales bacterium]